MNEVIEDAFSHQYVGIELTNGEKFYGVHYTEDIVRSFERKKQTHRLLDILK